MTTPPSEPPPRDSTPPPPLGTYSAIYVTVYEYTQRLIPGIPRTFMRHSSILVKSDPNVEDFELHHVIGTPSVGLTYTIRKNWKNPRDQTVSLLAMDFAAWIPRNRVGDLEAIFRQVRIQLNRNWNCQNWVREGLRKLVDAGLITSEQAQSASEKQQKAVDTPYTGNTPNLRALD